MLLEIEIEGIFPLDGRSETATCTNKSLRSHAMICIPTSSIDSNLLR